MNKLVVAFITIIISTTVLSRIAREVTREEMKKSNRGKR